MASVSHPFALVAAENAAYSARWFAREATVDAEGTTLDPDRLLDEAAEAGREQGLSLRSALIPAEYTDAQRAAYKTAFDAAFDYAEGESLERDFDDDYANYLETIAYADHGGAWGSSID